jgi:mediator of RNA polymerase II transcription subunit 20
MCLLTGPQRTLHVLHNSEQPASVFSILESGNKTIPLVADGLFDLLMNKMTSIYTSKKQTKIESKGPRFEIGDFCVKLGSVTMSQNFKGVLVEVSGCACSRQTVGKCGLPRAVGSLCSTSRDFSPANIGYVITELQT